MSRGSHGHNKKYFRQIPRESAGFKVTQNENFGLEQLVGVASAVYVADNFGAGFERPKENEVVPNRKGAHPVFNFVARRADERKVPQKAAYLL
jgi:hypothetical protein